MITVKIIGGLGNQLFQYATARRLAYVHKTMLKLDTTAFASYSLHEYVLNHLRIHAEIISKKELRKVRGFCAFPLVSFIFRKMNLSRCGALVRERSLRFDPSVLELSDNVYLDGYWQSEKYFQDIREILLKELVVADALSGQNEAMAKTISASNAISIHVRRGDYVNNSQTNKIHGVLSLEYYRAAIKFFEDKYDDAHFFIFSDDPAWVGEHLQLLRPHTFVEHNGAKKNYEDMRLMSMCKHNIIANSSFSWWGAWLNQNPNKIVVAPKKWFGAPKMHEKNLCPRDWVRI